MIGCRADGLRSLRERYAVVARRACEKPISRRGKRVKNKKSGTTYCGGFEWAVFGRKRLFHNTIATRSRIPYQSARHTIEETHCKTHTRTVVHFQ